VIFVPLSRNSVSVPVALVITPHDLSLSLRQGVEPMTMPRRVIPGTTHMLTRRCSRREYRLLQTKKMRQFLAYALTVVSARHGVEVHAAVAMTNHYHMVATDVRGVMPAFNQDFNSLVARAVNAEQGRHEAMWSSQRMSQVELVDAEDIWRKLVYTLGNPAAADLVDRLSHWPGFAVRLVDHERPPQVILRPTMVLFSGKTTMPETATLQLSVPRAFGDMTGKEFSCEARERLAVYEAELRAARKADGRHVLGVRELKRRHHTHRPASPDVRSGRDPAIASKNTPRRIAALHALRAFRDAYRAAFAKWRQHLAPVSFPYGTYKMRSDLGVLIDLPPPTALAS